MHNILKLSKLVITTAKSSKELAQRGGNKQQRDPNKTQSTMEPVSGGLVPIRNLFLLPTAKLDEQKFEFYFLLDISTSMKGENLKLAIRALLLFLQSLPADCYFNVIFFCDTFHPLFPKSVKYSQGTLEQARKAISGVKTGWGTNILSPLEHIYSQPQTPGYLTQIFPITDGCVSNRKAVLELVASKVKHSRSFSLGVGNKVDKKLVMGIAENAGGMFEFVQANELIESKILNQLKTALKPALLKPKRVAAASRLIPLYEP